MYNRLEEIPKRPGRNFLEWYEKQYKYGNRLKGSELLKNPYCTCCLGRMWLYHPDSRPDPVEGNKMRDTIKCPVCKGTGKGQLKHWKNLYNRDIEEWKNKKEKAIKLRTLQKSGLKKLTLAERKALSW